MSVERKRLEPGESTTLINAKIGSSCLLLEVIIILIDNLRCL